MAHNIHFAPICCISCAGPVNKRHGADVLDLTCIKYLQVRNNPDLNLTYCQSMMSSRFISGCFISINKISQKSAHSLCVQRGSVAVSPASDPRAIQVTPSFVAGRVTVLLLFVTPIITFQLQNTGEPQWETVNHKYVPTSSGLETQLRLETRTVVKMNL